MPLSAEGARPAKWPRRGEAAAHSAEHAILVGAMGLAIALFAIWQIHVWRDVLWPGVPDRDSPLVTMLRDAPSASSLALHATRSGRYIGLGRSFSWLSGVGW